MIFRYLMGRFKSGVYNMRAKYGPRKLFIWPAKPTILLIWLAFPLKTSFKNVKTCKLWPLNNTTKKILSRHEIWVVHPLFKSYHNWPSWLCLIDKLSSRLKVSPCPSPDPFLDRHPRRRREARSEESHELDWLVRQVGIWDGREEAKIHDRI